jgi:hypothetical protein
MADSRRSIAGLGRFNTATSPYAEKYLKEMRESRANVGGVLQDFAKEFGEIKTQERKALTMIPDADFTTDSGPLSAFSADAQEIKDKIKGGVEGAYNFADEADILRFNNDIAKFQKQITEAEVVYDQSIQGLQDLETAHNYFVKTGADPRQAPTENIKGVGEVYNAKIGMEAYDSTVSRATAMRQGKMEKQPDGTYVLRDKDGNDIGQYKTMEGYFEELVGLAKPDLQPVPVIDGLNFAIEEKWATQFDTESKAESAALTYVLNNPAIADRRAREVMGVSELAEQGEMSEEAKSMLAKHPNASARFDNLSDSQLAYAKEIVQGWRDLKKKQEAPKATATQTAKAQEKRKRKDAAMESIRVVGDEIQNAVRSGGLFEAVVGSGNMEPGTTAPGEKVTFPYSFDDSIQVTDEDGNELDLKVTQFSYDVFGDKIQLIGTTSKSSSPGQAETIVDKRVTIDGSNIDQIAKLDQLLNMEYDVKLAELFRKFTSGEYQKAPDFQGRTTQEETDAAMGGSTPKGTGLADGL